MGYVLVKANGQQEQQPFGIPAPTSTPPQAALSGGAVQVMVDPTYPAGSRLFGSSPVVGNDPAADPNAALGYTAPSHFRFTDQNTGQTTTEVNPLAGNVVTNPFGGENIHTRRQLAGMKGAKALGLGLGAYAALMGFADDSDQDVVSAALGAGLSGYSTYAQFAQLAQHFDRQGRSELANKLRDHANKQATEAFLEQNRTGAIYDTLPHSAWQSTLSPPPRRGETEVTEVPSSRDKGRTFYGTEGGVAELPSVDFIPNTDSGFVDDPVKDIDNTWAGHIPEIPKLTDEQKKKILDETMETFTTDEDGRIDFG
jgi:hypothetical protein